MYPWGMKTPVYVLVKLGIGSQGEVTRTNVDVTFSIAEAEAHRDEDVSHEFDTLSVDAEWQADASLTEALTLMREIRQEVEGLGECS